MILCFSCKLGVEIIEVYACGKYNPTISKYCLRTRRIHIHKECEREMEGGGRGTRKLKENLSKGEGNNVEP